MDRIALASTTLGILRLPRPLQQFHSARDMLDILAGEPCGCAGYILGQAHAVLDGYSGWRPGGHKAINWRKTGEVYDELEKLLAEALKKRRELIAEREALYDELEKLVVEDLEKLRELIAEQEASTGVQGD
jgi:hypothetical protein